MGDVQFEVRLAKGWCKLCGAEIEVYPGHYYCDRCIAAYERGRREVGIETMRGRMVRDAKARGLIEDEALEVTFAWAAAPPACNADAWRRGREWRWASGINAYLHGAQGTGKTTLATCMLTAALADDPPRSIGICMAMDIATIGRYSLDKLDRIIWPDALLIDDLAHAPWTVDGLTNLFAVFNARERRRRRTLVTANVAPAKLGPLLASMARVGANEAMLAALMDRLYTRAGAPMVLELTGPSLRGTFGGADHDFVASLDV